MSATFYTVAHGDQRFPPSSLVFLHATQCEVGERDNCWAGPLEEALNMPREELSWRPSRQLCEALGSPLRSRERS